MKILSWNVNGIRAAQKKGFLDWLQKESPDILGVQETKAHPEQLDMDIKDPPGYHVYWHSGEKKGYSSVAIFTKEEPIRVQKGIGIERFDREGRFILAEYKGFSFMSIYFPNGQRDDERLNYKMDFYDATLAVVEKLRKEGKELVISGDYNTAHHPIDLARPKENSNKSGFLPIERSWLDKFVKHGQIDIFRELHPEPNQYTWWDMKSYARDRNIGWRIDYHFITPGLRSKIKDAKIMADVMGSDHCPISLELEI